MSKAVYTGKTKLRGRIDARSSVMQFAASRFGGAKAQAALALAVSLWTANGGVASAAGTVTLGDEPDTSGTGFIRDYGQLYLDDGYNALQLTGGNWEYVSSLYAGYTETAGVLLSDYSLSVTGQVRSTSFDGFSLYGASDSGAAPFYGGTRGNAVHIKEAQLTGVKNITICGEEHYSDADATDGSVKISDSVISASGDIKIYGILTSANATGGSVTISGTRANANQAPATQLLTGDNAGDKNIDIYAANINSYAKKKAENGSVNLSGDVGFKGSVSLFGATDGKTLSGNTLRIGTDGTNDAVWRGYTKVKYGPWTRTNAVNNVKNFNTIALHAVEFTDAFPALSVTGEFSGNGTLDLTNLSFVNENGAAYVPTSGSMTLLDTATDLTGMKLAYNATTQATPVALTTATVKVAEKSASDMSAGVTLDYTSTYTVALANASKAVACSVASQADKLTFGSVEWKDTDALIDHNTKWADVPFGGAAVDTSNIWFTSGKHVASSRKTTLVKAFGDTAGTITGTTFKAGSTLQGRGNASLVGNDLIFTVATKPGTGDPDIPGSGEPDIEPQEQTHNSLMGAGAGMVVLSAGNDFIGGATDGLGQAGSTGADGVAAYAQMGGGTTRQETGSHIDVHGWNAIIALGHKNEKEKSAFEYGAFFEYGTGNYSTFNGDLRGDGSMRYTGGGLLAKWAANSGTYIEGSLRAGSIHGETNGVLRDFFDNPYHYEIDTPYWGLHFGVGKEFALANGDAVDVYGKYFFNRRNSTSFDAGGQYDLDALTSKILRVGARYTMKREKWNFYGGLAYEHEFDGVATGTADGFAIRSTDPSGDSVRAELGAAMTPENSPWSLDLNLAGFAGKKRGITGGVSVAFMF